jgi:hypothetical protein
MNLLKPIILTLFCWLPITLFLYISANQLLPMLPLRVTSVSPNCSLPAARKIRCLLFPLFPTQILPISALPATANIIIVIISALRHLSSLYLVNRLNHCMGLSCQFAILTGQHLRLKAVSSRLCRFEGGIVIAESILPG